MVLDPSFNGDFDLDGKSCQHAEMGETEKVWKVIKFIISFIIPFAVISKQIFLIYYVCFFDPYLLIYIFIKFIKCSSNFKVFFFPLEN